MHQVAATAAFELVRAGNRHTLGRRVQDLDHPGTGPALVDLGYLTRDRLPRERPFDEDDTAVLGAGDTGSITSGGCHQELHAGTVSALSGMLPGGQPAGDSFSTAATISAIEKNTWSNAGRRPWSTDSATSDLR